ncbi:putative uncharacterized protein [Candidatus Apopatosoma intestinale]|nr:putative uncharacterized protein [Candidatus Apopatosoma intestinale]
MDKTFLSGSNLNKSADGDNPCYGAVVAATLYRLEYDGIDDSLGILCGLLVNCENINRAVILDINLSACLGNNLLDYLAAGTDDIANLIGIYLHCYHLGSILAHFLSGSGNSLEDNFIYDIISALVSLCESLPDYFRCKTVNLQIHLNGGDTLVCAGNLEVHIAVEIFETLNINHRIPRAVLCCDKTAGNAGYRSLYRNTRIHECECRAAYGSLRGRAV